jgi:hypothetical protein
MAKAAVTGLLGAQIGLAFEFAPARTPQLELSRATTAVDAPLQETDGATATPTSTTSTIALGAVGTFASAALLMRAATAKKAASAPLFRQDRSLVRLGAFESELGAQAPFGFWDPAGMCKDGDAETFKRRRETEIKHGRVSMIACIGYMLPEYYKFPGFCSKEMGLAFKDIPNGLAALSKVPGAGWVQIFLFIGAVEKALLVYDPSRAPGDFANGGVLGVPNGSTMPEGDAKKRKLSSEIANGRLAMMAIIGMFYQDGLTGSAWGDWSLYTDSPLRAFESEPGVQPPVGYWDPIGLAADGNISDYKRRRETELKHGRVSMFATIGYIVPEYYRIPGFLSPSYGVKYADVPNGLGALSKVPALGWLQIVTFVGLIEINVYGENINGEPGNYGAGFLGLRSVGVMNTGVKDPETRKKKLCAELANGRLAMMAIIGMFFQDGCTGSAWGDWALYEASPLR